VVREERTNNVVTQCAKRVWIRWSFGCRLHSS